ncbi:hypothetical protein ACS0TY_031250 [Phlomoides rotata]
MSCGDEMLSKFLYSSQHKIKMATSSSSLSPCFSFTHLHSRSPLHRGPFESCLIPPLPLKQRAPKFWCRAALDNDAQISSSILVQQQLQLTKEVEDCVRLLKNAAKTRKVPQQDILQAFSVIEKANLDPSRFLQTLGGTNSPGRTWMLVFTAQTVDDAREQRRESTKKLGRGKYFPITAVQRFDAAGKRIENGVYLGPLGCLTFEGRFSWKKRILSFIFEQIRIKIGPFNPIQISFKGKDEREPSNEDPFFIWFYADEEIAVARGKSGGTAFWVRCQRLAY